MIDYLNKKVIIASAVVVILLVGGVIAAKKHEQKTITFENVREDERLKESTSEEAKITEQIQEKEDEIVIHIIGQVKIPGVIKIPGGSRISDAIIAAGGTTEEADIEAVNLAFKLEDGQQVYIPTRAKNQRKILSKQKTAGTNAKKAIPIVQQMQSNNFVSELPGGVKSSTEQEEKTGKVNINTAGISELDTLPGIGPSTAQKIIEFRNKNGKFKKIEDITKISGIGKAKYEEIKDKIVI